MKNHHTKGQMEMIGLAFVVLIMVLGFFLYISLTLNSNNAPKALIEEAHLVGIALETAMLETTLESCGYTLATAIERCATNHHLTCGSTAVCEVTHETIGLMLEATLGTDSDLDTAPVRRPYRAYLLQGTDVFLKDGHEFMYEDAYFDLCNENSSVLAAPSQPIHVGGSANEISFVIEFCG